VQYEELPALLLAEIPGFEASPEFGLVAYASDLPGIVVAAMGRYLARLEQKGAEESEIDAPDAIYQLLERMAASRDPEVQNAVQVEVFENLDPSRSVTRRIVEKLGPSARTLYADWNERQS
jgi:hypothetical protein